MIHPDMTPNSDQHHPNPLYLRRLVAQTGFSQAECARRIGLNPSTLRRNLANGTRTALKADYRTQYALERLALHTRIKENPMDTATLSPAVRNSIAECALRLGVSDELALEMAVNRMHIAVMNLSEGDLNDVDFSQSLPDEPPRAGATSKSLPGFEEA